MAGLAAIKLAFEFRLNHLLFPINIQETIFNFQQFEISYQDFEKN